MGEVHPSRHNFTQPQGIYLGVSATEPHHQRISLHISPIPLVPQFNRISRKAVKHIESCVLCIFRRMKVTFELSHS